MSTPLEVPSWVESDKTEVWLVAGHGRGHVADLVEAELVASSAGTGLNAALFPVDVDRVMLSEPDPAMRQRLRQRLASLGCRYEILDAPADQLPVDSGAVDTVVSTLVLCTVVDVAATLAEIRRVLAPGGTLILIEHVRAAGPRLCAWQDRLHKPWLAFAEGCHCNRDTVAALRDAGFNTAQLHVARWKRMPPIVTPLVFGCATPGGATRLCDRSGLLHG